MAKNNKMVLFDISSFSFVKVGYSKYFYHTSWFGVQYWRKGHRNQNCCPLSHSDFWALLRNCFLLIKTKLHSNKWNFHNKFLLKHFDIAFSHINIDVKSLDNDSRTFVCDKYLFYKVAKVRMCINWIICLNGT